MYYAQALGIGNTESWYHIFDTKAGRDRWVNNKEEAYRFFENRRSVTTKDPGLRRVIYEAKRVTEGDSDYEDMLHYHYEEEEISDC